VLDVPNGLAWSRLTQSSLESQVPSPNPSTAQLPSSEFGPSMSFVREMCCAVDSSEVVVSGRPSAEDVVVSGCPSAEEVVVSGHPSAEEVIVSGASSAKDVVVPASSPLSSDLLSSESVSQGNSSSVLSRQVSVVLPASHYGHISTASSRLDPRVPPFQPRSRSCTWKEPSPSLPVDTTSSLAYWPSTSYVGFNDETLVKTPFCSESVCTLDAQDITVPTHLQDLFDQTVQYASLSLSTHQDLAALLRKNAKAFATSKSDLGYCADLQHDIDTGDALPIKQSPRRHPLSARQAEMLDTGVIQPSNSPWSSPVCMVRKKDDSFRFCIDYRRVNAVTIKDAFPALMLRTLSIVSAVLNTLPLLTYFQDTGS